MGSAWNLLAGGTISEQLAYSALRGITENGYLRVIFNLLVLPLQTVFVDRRKLN
jgi:hypothetical protein